jgi:hypothetical protein
LPFFSVALLGTYLFYHCSHHSTLLNSSTDILRCKRFVVCIKLYLFIYLFIYNLRQITKNINNAGASVFRIIPSKSTDVM